MGAVIRNAVHVERTTIPSALGQVSAMPIGTKLSMRVYRLTKVDLDLKALEEPVLAAAGIETVATTRLVVSL